MATKRRAVSKRRATKRVAILRNTEGYKDRRGVFHPGKSTGARRKAAVKRTKTRAKNPAFPVGKFVKVDAVKLNRNGTIDIMRSKSKRPRR